MAAFTAGPSFEVECDQILYKFSQIWWNLYIIWSRFSIRTLTYNDEQFHILEKIKMQETIRVLADLLQKDAAPSINKLTEAVADWYKMAQTTFLQTEILHSDIVQYEDEIETFQVALRASQVN